jgi:hypothetical protein
MNMCWQSCWEASDERLKNLRDIYLEAEGLLEERINNKQEVQG